MTANITNDTRKKIYRRDGYHCALCDSNKGLQVHPEYPDYITQEYIEQAVGS